MKKYIIFSFIIGLLFTACDPNKDIYDDIKNNEKPYFETGLEYTLTADDYSYVKKITEATATNKTDSLWADYINQYSSFNTKYTAYKYIPSILAKNFPALNDSSNIVVTFNQYIGEMYGNIITVVLNDNDYLNMGGDIATDSCFSDPADLNNLPGFLLNKLSHAEANDYAEVFFRYPNAETTAGSFYKFNGFQWIAVENSRVLAPADYDEMGGPTGSYFSEDAMPGNYLPQFLTLHYPYAQDGDELAIVCHLVDFESVVYVISCKYNGSDWEINFPGKATTSQFKHDGEKWYFDPTIIFTMSSDDYQLIVDYVTNSSEIPAGYLDATFGYNTEYYYGANAHYANFYLKLAKRRDYDPLGLLTGLSDEDAMANIWERVKEGIVVMLQLKFPDAVPSIEGVEVHYFITFKIYNGGNYWYQIEYKCASAGSPPTFELVTDAVDITGE